MTRHSSGRYQGPPSKGPLKALREVKYVSTTKLPFLVMGSDMALAGVHYLTPFEVVSGRIRLSTTIGPLFRLGTIGLILIHHFLSCVPYIDVTFSASSLLQIGPTKYLLLSTSRHFCYHNPLTHLMSLHCADTLVLYSGNIPFNCALRRCSSIIV